MKYLLPLLFLFSCFARPNMMTRQDFSDITIGESIADVEKKVGQPYSITKKANGAQEYEYIERIPLGTEVVEENHYYLVIRNGQVVSKRLNKESQPAYDMIYDDDPNDTDQQ